MARKKKRIKSKERDPSFSTNTANLKKKAGHIAINTPNGRRKDHQQILWN